MYKSYKFYLSVSQNGFYRQKGGFVRNGHIYPIQDWSKAKPIAPFSCTPRVKEVHTKAEVVNPTPGQLGLVVNIQYSRIGNVLRKYN